ncbi:hypothetical protein [Streptomyces viridochromogenes]|uniref:Integral membrane protein n=1 Tax=Streptomyces viridochromogenes Tue57 TaxID=1160705 RepID=L8PE21_STRVR|nr:hypothetical protein [Streptomyces viridochromogenes]ELS53592.1 hypothetical protein STVIR_5512 [Streptomyces viridochromogenes Tue57]
MGQLKVTLCAGAAVVAATLTPTAYAADGGGISMTPTAPAPGADVALRVGDCAGSRTGTAVSAAFVTDVRLTGTDGTLAGESRVRSTLTAGTYDVKVSCGDATRTGALTVVAPGSPSTAPPSRHPAAPASPVAPVQAGGGGAAELAVVDARAAGPGTAHTVTGLVLAGVAATAVALRSARRSRRQR